MGYVSTSHPGNRRITTHNTAQCPELQFSVSRLREQANLFTGGFKGETSYAVKANAHPVILKVFYECGIRTFDVASIAETQLVRETVPGAQIHYHNPIRSTEEVAAAYFDHGCRRFAVDSTCELEKIHRLITKPASVEIAVRFRCKTRSDAVQAFNSKFGADACQAGEIVLMARKMGFCVGLTFHPGSQTRTPTPYVDHCKKAAQIMAATGVPISFLNVGGGFPVQYDKTDAPVLQQFFEDIVAAANNSFRGNQLRLECEPGRALVSPAGDLVTTVKAVRSEQAELFLNDGIYGGLLEVSQFPEMKPRHESDRICQDTAQQKDWTVFGPTCDPLDVLPFKLRLPANMAEGDTVRFIEVGAYSSATATRFNGYGGVVTRFL